MSDMCNSTDAIASKNILLLYVMAGIPVSGHCEVISVPLVLTPLERRDHELPQQRIHPLRPAPRLQPQCPQHDLQHGLALVTVNTGSMSVINIKMFSPQPLS